ncbi:MAG: hypothetical protein ACM3Y9_12725 [Ignavibacteria bacterium]
MNRAGRSQFRSTAIAAEESQNIPVPSYCPIAVPAHLMPYEAAAKAIFVRANGTAAYYKATGIVE